MLYSAMLKTLFRRVYGELPEASAEGEGVGLVLVADGVGGLDLCGMGLKYEVARAGLPLAVEVVPWGHGLGRWHADLTNVENHVARAAATVARLNEFRAAKPGAPVFLVGKSGGTGLVARVLEDLPEGAVEAAVLLSPALSPGYDLGRALRAVRREMVVFWSPLDLVVLGLGTRVFGTIDRVNSVSAGLVGFRTPGGADEAGYAKLRQVRWHPEMAPTGYLGGHVGPDSPAFLRKYVLPLLSVTATESGGPAAEGSSRAHAAPIT
jgi:pimeloyl-ACP methyl ester carboxylesterase